MQLYIYAYICNINSEQKSIEEEEEKAARRLFSLFLFFPRVLFQFYERERAHLHRTETFFCERDQYAEILLSRSTKAQCHGENLSVELVVGSQRFSSRKELSL